MRTGQIWAIAGAVAYLTCSVDSLAIPEGPAYPSAAWTQREVQNFAGILQAPREQLANPAFPARLQAQGAANLSSLVARDLADPSWLVGSSPALAGLLATLFNPLSLSTTLQSLLQSTRANPVSALSLSLDSPMTPPCAAYALVCDGDPFRFPGSPGPDAATFYTSEAVVTPVVFYDSSCARLVGQVWRPRDVASGKTLPGVVIQNGSVEAPQVAYWWAAQLLVRNGYVVLTYDPRGQGRSDFETPAGGQGSNANPSVFWTGLVDAIDFFRSSPRALDPNNVACRGTTVIAPYNPEYARVNPQRLGIAGHSLGAIAVSVVQGYGGAGADPWPGKLDRTNPVKVAVAWDGLLPPGGANNAGGAADGGLVYALRQLPLTAAAIELVFERGLPSFVPRVPVMSQDSEYGLVPTPWIAPPDPDEHRAPAQVWVDAGVPVFDFTIRSSTHYEWSLSPLFPTTSWCPDPASGACSGGFGNTMAQYYTLAWLDRWLKAPGESGYADADARLLDDNGPQGAAKMSLYFRSSRKFPDRSGRIRACTDIRAGCGT